MANTKIPVELSSTPGIVDNSNATAITIDSSENVGIGGSTITDVNLLNIQGSGASKNIGVVFNDTNTSKIFAIQNGGSALKFFDYTASAERMRIDSSGNVGIGAAPTNFSNYNNLDVRSKNTSGGAIIGIHDTDGVRVGGISHSESSPALDIEAFNSNPIRFFTGSESMRIDSSGNLMVGRASSLGGGLLTVQSNNSQGLAIGYGTGTNEYRRLYHHSSGLYFESSTNQAYLSAAGAWTNASDVTLKKDIEDIDYGIETVKSLKPRKYKMKSDDEAQIGFIAQELVEQVPEIVGGREGLLGVSYGQLTAVLTKAIQEQQAQIDALQSEINLLKGE